MSTPAETTIEPRKRGVAPTGALRPRKEDVVEPLEFEFSWMANGARQTTKIAAQSYANACWQLGIIHAQLYGLHRWPQDFELVLDGSAV